MTIQQRRAHFNEVTAPLLAAKTGVATPSKGSRSARFAYFADESRFVIVAGSQEGTDVDLALAFGLTYRGDRHLVLVLPQDHAFATLQRIPWLRSDLQPELWLHAGTSARLHSLPTREDSIAQLVARLKAGQSVKDELRDAATPTHLGARSASVFELVEWATTHPLLDGSHRRGERAWHCMGQRVLSIRRTSSGVAVTAGIHYSEPARAPKPVPLGNGSILSEAQFEAVQQAANAAAEDRLSGSPPIHRPDEHWLQAVIRRDPSLVGVEQPALRELPAWRPRGGLHDESEKRWGRGYIDLIGVDGHGDVRVVETKIADNQDDLLILQGLDYLVWARAYRDVLLERLGASQQAAFEIHYVIGDTTDGKIHVSKFSAAIAHALHPSVRWRFQTVHDWYRGPMDAGRAHSRLHPMGQLP